MWKSMCRQSATICCLNAIVPFETSFSELFFCPNVVRKFEWVVSHKLISALCSISKHLGRLFALCQKPKPVYNMLNWAGDVLCYAGKCPCNMIFDTFGPYSLISLSQRVMSRGSMHTRGLCKLNESKIRYRFNVAKCVLLNVWITHFILFSKRASYGFFQQMQLLRPYHLTLLDCKKHEVILVLTPFTPSLFDNNFHLMTEHLKQLPIRTKINWIHE